MDSTLTPIPISTQPQQQQPSPSSAHKLPIKRKKPDQPPFKYHRIWTESDEIRFLQGLLDSSSDHLSFPRDLHVFYSRFSLSMSQPYSRSQLSEKLRRLRKKFRVVSARLARGVLFDSLSGHDKALFGLSRRLWGTEFQKVSPFCGKGAREKRVCFSPLIDGVNDPVIDNESKNDDDENDNEDDNAVFNEEDNAIVNDDDNDNAAVNEDVNVVVNEDVNGVEVDGDDDSEMKEVKIDYDFGKRRHDEVVLEESMRCLDGSVSAVGNIVIDVFDKTLKEVRAELLSDDCEENGSSSMEDSSSKGKSVEFAKRWQEQRATELDVLARRMRLVIENLLHG